MPLFRRGRNADDLDDDLDVDGEEYEPNELDDDDDAGEDASAPPPRPSGPWDIEDIGHDDSDGVPRVDLGALRIPVPEGVEMRVEVQPDHVATAATLVQGHSAIQVHVFAAPRTLGIWDDVRAEIVESLRGNGGSAEETDGPFGRELRARVPAEVPGQGVQLQPARFVGVDGPRWFLRGLLTGPAATDPNQARVLEEAFRGCVVVRGQDAMAPRDLVPLRLPREAAQALAEQQALAEAERQKPTLDMLARGPEITETR